MSARKPPISKPAPGLRQRWRARSRDWRIWWEPSASQRAAGLKVVELDANRLTWSNKKAAALTRQAEGALQRRNPVSRRNTNPGKNSIDALVTAYLDPKNRRFHKNSTSHKKNVRYDIGRILDRWGGTAARNLTKPVVYTWYETLCADHGLRLAQRLVGTLSTLLSYGALKGVVPYNPLIRMGMETPEPRARLISWPEYDALDAASDRLSLPSMRLTLALSMFMGQRGTDCWNVTAGDFVQHVIDKDQGPVLCWRLVRSKDRKQKLNYLQVHPEVRPHIDAALARLAAADWPGAPIDDTARLVIQDNSGNPMNENYFQQSFAKIRAEAADRLPSVKTAQFRDLRRTFSNNARHAGMVSDDVDDALGNTAGSDPNLRQVYMPASDERAASAILAVQRPKETKKRA